MISHYFTPTIFFFRQLTLANTLPRINAYGTGPYSRESVELLILSPCSHTCPRGTLQRIVFFFVLMNAIKCNFVINKEHLTYSYVCSLNCCWIGANDITWLIIRLSAHGSLCFGIIWQTYHSNYSFHHGTSWIPWRYAHNHISSIKVHQARTYSLICHNVVYYIESRKHGRAHTLLTFKTRLISIIMHMGIVFIGKPTIVTVHTCSLNKCIQAAPFMIFVVNLARRWKFILYISYFDDVVNQELIYYGS